MDIGFCVPVAGSWATPVNQVAIARRAEELGYASLWSFQRLLVPEPPDQRSALPTYRSVLDPVASLAYVAAVTTTIRLGLAVVNIPFFSPALLAKQLATLDILSGGRLDAGLGNGWSAAEYAAVGVPQERRGARAEEFVHALKALWTQDVAEFHGEFYEIPPARMSPKPVQRPHPPLLLGGTAAPALRRAGRLMDGWVAGSTADLSRIGEPIEVVRRAASEAGRDPDTLRYVARGVVRVRAAGAPERAVLTGSLQEIRGDLDGLAAQGLSEVFLDLNFDPEVGSPDADPAASRGTPLRTVLTRVGITKPWPVP
jgi:probable F420-dependent oxidoreductase